jgi:hypothetical protein
MCKLVCIENRIGPERVCLGELPGKKQKRHLVQPYIKKQTEHDFFRVRLIFISNLPLFCLLFSSSMPNQTLAPNMPIRVRNVRFARNDTRPRCLNLVYLESSKYPYGVSPHLFRDHEGAPDMKMAELVSAIFMALEEPHFLLLFLFFCYIY